MVYWIRNGFSFWVIYIYLYYIRLKLTFTRLGSVLGVNLLRYTYI